jgi:transcription elongation factor Elf1
MEECKLCRRKLSEDSAGDKNCFVFRNGKNCFALCGSCFLVITELINELAVVLDLYPESVDQIIPHLEYLVCLHKKAGKKHKDIKVSDKKR